MRKKILTITILLLIIVASIFTFKFFNTKKYKYEIEKVNEYNYYVFVDAEKYGVIDKEGNIIIEAKYENIVIPNPQKDTFICYKTDNEAEVLDAKKEAKFTGYESVEPIKLKSVASTLSFEKNTLVYKQDGKYGLLNFDGKKITKNVYDSIENLAPTEGKYIVSQNQKYGVIDLKGNTIVKPEYDKISSDGYYTEKDQYKKSGFIVSVKTDDGYRCGYISYIGKSILDTKYNEIERITKEDEKNVYLIASKNGKNGLYKNSKSIIQNEYQSISYDDNDVLILQKNKKYGVAKLDGKIIIPIEKDTIESKGIYLYVKSSNNNKVYDNQGNVIDINYNRTIYKTENDDYKISTILNNNIMYYGILDKNGNKLVDEKYRYIEYLYQNYFVATNDDGDLGVINSNGKEVLEMKYSSLQKIKGKNIIQAVEKGGNTSEFYSLDMKKTLTANMPNIQVQDDHIVVVSDCKKDYLDNDGNLIQDISGLKKESYPDTIGDYNKVQVTVENVYYVKK